MSTVPGWVIPGAPAVILQPYSGSPLRAQAVLIERVLKRLGDLIIWLARRGDR